jgi:glycine oxidase
MKRAFDVCIVGGGVIGMSAALELARERLKVCVVERGRLGREASWAAGGILTPIHLADYPEPLRRLAEASARMYPAWVRGVRALSGIDPELIRSGALLPVRTDAEEREVRKVARYKREHGGAFEFLSARKARLDEPALAPAAAARGALLLPDILQVRSNRLCDALAAALRRSKVRILEGTLCHGAFDRRGGARVETPRGAIDADRVVLAAGSWTGSLAKLRVRPVRGQIFVAQGPRRLLRRIVMAGPLEGLSRDLYLVPRRDGRILVGSTVERVGFDATVTVEALAFLAREAVRLVPALGGLTFVQAWAGLRPEGPRKAPTIGTLPGTSNILAAAGHYRNGILLAPVTAAIVRDLVLGSSRAPVDPAPYAP